jgi:glycolate oxidase FAD binding subunit
VTPRRGPREAASERIEVPETPEDAASLLRAASDDRRSVRFKGAGTKLGWGRPADTDVTISTLGLGRLLEHNAGDLTAVLEPGVPLAEAQRAFAAAGQMLALDPPDPGGATIGGMVATADSGPLRHRYGAPRDLVLGIRVALADGTLARAGSRVIKNVAGYDLAKLFAGAFGTLGLIVEVIVRLHPLPARRITAVGRSDDPEAVQRAALAVGRAALELESLDVRWNGEAGTILARVAGVAPAERAATAEALMSREGLAASVDENDDARWESQRDGQRSIAEGAVVRVSAVASELSRVIRAVDFNTATVVGRAGLGQFWVTLPAAPDGELISGIEHLRAALAPRPCVVQDAPATVREDVDVWGPVPGGALSRTVKSRFDPTGTCNPGIFVEDI